jgi:hypothetical protein
MKLRTTLAALVSAPLLVACSSDVRHHPPAGVGGCSHMFMIGDAGTGIGLDWDSEFHGYDDAVPIYVCEAGSTGGTASVTAPSRVVVSPSRAEVTAPSLVQFMVRVERGGHGPLRFTFTDSGGGVFGNAALPVVVAAGSGWHFAADS